MKFRKLAAPSLRELFVTELEGKILSGELKIGAKLPSERELAASMQVSRTVVSAGIAEMEQKGFLLIRPRIGTFVADYRKYGTLDSLVSIMRYNGGALARNEIKSILELRAVLVNLAATLCIKHATDAAIQTAMYPILDQIRQCATNEDLVECTFRLYHALAGISGNSLLPPIFVSFHDLVCQLWLRYVINYGREPLVASDETLVSLLLARDLEGTRRHISFGSQESISGSRQLYE